MSDEAQTALVRIRRAANLPETFADERIQAIRDFCVPAGLKITTSHLAMFLATCHRYDLDPLLGEIWLAEIEGKITCVTGRNSLVKLASRKADFGGITSGVVHEKDTWAAEMLPDGQWMIVHQMPGMDRGKIVGAYCLLHFKDGKPPIFKQRLWADYTHLHSKKNWRTSPKDMIEIRALTACLRQAYPMSGLYDPSEAELEVGDVQVIESGAAQERTLSEAERLRARLAAEIKYPATEDGVIGVVEEPKTFDGIEGVEDDLALDKELAAEE